MAYSGLAILLDDMKRKISTRVFCVGIVIVIKNLVGVSFGFELLHFVEDALLSLVVASEAAYHFL